MPQIFKIKDTQALTSEPAFRAYSVAMEGPVCIAVASLGGLDELVTKGVLKAIPLQPFSEEERGEFIHDYTAFIASLNFTYKDQSLWWATDISSKNRYVSSLPDLIEEILEIERTLKYCKKDPLLIIAPSIAIFRSLDKLMAKYQRKLIWPNAGSRAFLQQTTDGLINISRTILHAGRFFLRALWARISLKKYAKVRLSPPKEFYVIKTFSFPSSWDNKENYTDPFFGQLPSILSKDKNVLLLSYHWQGFQEFIKRIPKQETLTMFPVEYFLKGSDIFRALMRILTFQLEVPRELYFSGVDVSDILRFELARTLNGVQIFQLLHYDTVRNMLKEMRIETFLLTFENNPWERMCIRACRDHSPMTQVLGCQHTVVPEAALNMFVYPTENTLVPLPDRVLTTGEIPKNIILRYSDYGQVPVVSACALRYEYLFSIKPKPRLKSQGHILLVLDGVEQTQQMLQFVLGQLGSQRPYRLRIRCHPALPWSLLTRKFHIDISPYDNVEISEGALSEDLEWSDMIIYWQSTVVLEAINWGKPAINYKPSDILSYDPLFQSDFLKWTVTQQGSLLDAIAVIEDMDENKYQEQLAQALAYNKKYFHPQTPKALELFR